MAAGATVRVRLHNQSDEEVKLEDIRLKIRNNIKYWNLQEIEIVYEAALTAGTGTAISVANAVFDGTTTAATVYVDSTSASDTGVITIIGLTSSGIVSEDITMTGTTAVESSNSYIRLIHAYLSSGADAVGTITVQDDAAGTTKYLTIAAGAVDSDGCKLYFLNTHHWLIDEIEVVPTVVGGATRIASAYAINQGVEGINAGDNDNTRVIVSASTDSAGIKAKNHQVWIATTGADDGDPSCDFQEGVTTGGSAQLKFHIFVWNTASRGGGLD